MLKNPFIDFAQTPPYAEVTPDQARAALEQVLTEFKSLVDTAARAPCTWTDLWEPLSAGLEQVSRVWGQIRHIHFVIDSEAWRKLHQEYAGRLTTAFNELFQSRGVYDNLCALRRQDLSAEQAYLLQRVLLEFDSTGVGLAPAAQKSFMENAAQLAKLSAKFNENVMEATDAKAQTLVVTTEAQLGEMPEDLKAAARTDRGWEFSLKQPSYAAFMGHSPDRALKRELYYRYNIRASELSAEPGDNGPLIDEILKLRQAQAALLGHENYAEYSLKDKMAGAPGVVGDFLQNLLDQALPHARAEMDALVKFAATRLGIDDVQPWDLAYVADHYCREKFNFNPAELRPYLQSEKILSGMLAGATRVFGVTFVRLTEPSWHPDVLTYEARTADNEKIGRIYFDLYARDNKKGGGWMKGALARCQRGGRQQLPSAYVVCNFSPPADDGVPLLNWEEVRVLFHEFGHALHYTLTEANDYWTAGTNNVEWDAVELPSQFMENFMWDWRVLGPATAHVTSGEPLPEELFHRARAARNYNSALFLVRQLRFALFDFRVHTTPAPQPLEIFREVHAQTAFLPVAAWERFPCAFPHIFAGGYAAGYYSYLWAEGLAADAFDAFVESGDTLNSDLGNKFRQAVLARGSSRPALECFIDFRGRALDPTALLRHHGLIE